MTEPALGRDDVRSGRGEPPAPVVDRIGAVQPRQDGGAAEPPPISEPPGGDVAECDPLEHHPLADDEQRRHPRPAEHVDHVDRLARRCLELRRRQVVDEGMSGPSVDRDPIRP